jgi:hypothetical protein
VAQRYQPLFNLPITNVPGPQVPLFLQGARLVQQFNSAPLFDSMGLVIVAVSYQGQLTLNFTLCPDVVADGDAFKALTEESLASIEEAVASLGPDEGNELPASGSQSLTDELMNYMEGFLKNGLKRFKR